MNELALLSVLLGALPLSPVDRTTGVVLRDILLILGAVVLLTLPLILWARHYARRPKRHRREHHASHRPDAGEAEADSPQPDSHRRHHHHRRHRRRRRRREHRGRNPTLAETGGLPPIRTEPTPKPPV